MSCKTVYTCDACGKTIESPKYDKSCLHMSVAGLFNAIYHGSRCDTYTEVDLCEECGRKTIDLLNLKIHF